MANYNSKHTGSQIETAVARALPGGAIDKSIAEKMHALESTDYPGCYYRMVNGVQEWINPPTVAGVEFRTTERRSAKPVYTRLIDCGNMPAAGSVAIVQAPYDEAANPIATAWIYNSYLSYYNQSLPRYTTGSPTTVAYGVATTASGLININCGDTDLTNADAHLFVTLKYTKTTD